MTGRDRGANRPGHRHPRARKRFGQHYLVDSAVLREIADLVEPSPEDLVLEVGPGRGALTRPLLERLDRLVAVEIDRDLVAYLRRSLDHPKLRLLEGDVLALDFDRLLADEGRRSLFVVGNLPYNITAPVLFRLRSQARIVRRAILTLQKEVAERLVASAGTKAYSRLTVLLGQCARIEIRRHIASTAFRPRPQVESAVVDLQFVGDRVPVADLRAFEVLVRTAFAQRRKMLRNALQSLPDAHGGVRAPTAVETAARAAEVDLSQRAEDLSIGQFARLAAELARVTTP